MEPQNALLDPGVIRSGDMRQSRLVKILYLLLELPGNGWISVIGLSHMR